MELNHKYLCHECEQKNYKKVLCTNVVYESDYELVDVFNSYFSEIGVAFDEDVSNVDGFPLKYLHIL